MYLEEYEPLKKTWPRDELFCMLLRRLGELL